MEIGFGGGRLYELFQRYLMANVKNAIVPAAALFQSRSHDAHHRLADGARGVTAVTLAGATRCWSKAGTGVARFDQALGYEMKVELGATLHQDLRTHE